jgi:geranylgeranyl diphosphate synthase type I
VAILVGDLAHSYADALVAGAAPRTRWLWRQLQVELVAGQYLDVACTAAGGTDEDRARRIARLKSGRYTIEQPLRLGASLRDDERSPAEVAALDVALEAFGAPLGMAFQLRDDVLGAVGDPAVTGKPVGDDLRTGKPTALLAMARAAADPSQRRLLDRVGDDGLDDEDVARLQQVLVDTGALDELRDEIDDLVGASLLALRQGPFPPATAEALAEVAAFVVGRDH